MTALIAALSGMLCGGAGCALPARCCERAVREGRHAMMGRAAASLLGSFAALTAVLAIVRAAAPGWFTIFALSLAAAFILAWSLEAARICRFLNGSDHHDGKEA